jgi:hypothetical protein
VRIALSLSLAPPSSLSFPLTPFYGQPFVDLTSDDDHPPNRPPESVSIYAGGGAFLPSETDSGRPLEARDPAVGVPRSSPEVFSAPLPVPRPQRASPPQSAAAGAAHEGGDCSKVREAVEDLQALKAYLEAPNHALLMAAVLAVSRQLNRSPGFSMCRF